MSATLFKPEDKDTPLRSHEEESQIQTECNTAGAAAATSISQICDELIANAISALDLNATTTSLLASTKQSQSLCCDGSDNGVELAICSTNVTLQRALTSNSGGYMNSTGGFCADESQFANNTSQTISCNSSLISCSSDLYEMKRSSTRVPPLSRSPNSYECLSENGNESSLVLDRTTDMAEKLMTTMALTPTRRVSGSVKKKAAMFEPHEKSKEAFSHPSAQSKCGLMSTLKRAVSLPRSSNATTLSQGRCQKQNMSVVRDAESSTTLTTVMVTNGNAQPMTSTRGMRPQKPGTLPSTLNRTQSISMQRLMQRTPSLSRARTPGTPSDDGRWPAATTPRSGVSRRGFSMTPDLAMPKMRSNMLVVAESGVSGGQRGGESPSPYGTLPRRRKQQSAEDLTAGGRGSRSNSITRESRMTSSVVIIPTRKSLAPTFATPTQQTRSTSRLTASNGMTASMRKPQKPKTRIYHETAVQTALTSHDLEEVFSGGVAIARPVDAVEQREQSTQSDIRDVELERLRDELRQMAQREHELSAKLQREREEKLSMQRELHLNTERVMSMLEMARVVSANAGTPTSEEGDASGSGHDSLLMLESQIQLSGHELIERQHEIGQLRQLCRSLQLEMQRSLGIQECLLQEKAVMEQESSEMQDFLQHEKAAMCDALKELEADYQSCKQQLTSREEEVKVLRDECRHLVRLNEQRRQENRLLQTKYAALESKSKDMVMQQSASVSGASSALAGLHIRLDNLVEQLVYSYSISEQDLGDIGFQNEANNMNGNGGSLNDNAIGQQQNDKASANGLDLPLQQGGSLQPIVLLSDGSLSPQRNQSFIAAVISAIRNATTTHSGKRLSLRHGKRANLAPCHTYEKHSQEKQNGMQSDQTAQNGGGDSDSTEMLDSETEPCLMMDNVLEDVVQPDSHSHNMVSSSCTGMISQIELPTELVNATNGDDSLLQLSQAITNRQQMEMDLHMKLSMLPIHGRDQCNSEDLSCQNSLAELPSLMEYSCTQALVDQVIEVDTLVTKLLKVLRLIQLDNDNCIQQLIVDKNKLQQHKEDMLEKLKDLEDINIKLQDELMDATQELMLKGSDLSSAKAEMQRHRNEIDRLNEDICTLSTLCSNYKKLSPTTEFPPMQLLTTIKAAPDDGDVLGILNLLKMWQSEGQLQDSRVCNFLRNVCGFSNGKSTVSNNNNNNEARLHIYANQLENVLKVLRDCNKFDKNYPTLQQLRTEIECVKLNASWTHVLSGKVLVETQVTNNQKTEEARVNGDDLNANALGSES